MLVILLKQTSENRKDRELQNSSDRVTIFYVPIYNGLVRADIQKLPYNTATLCSIA